MNFEMSRYELEDENEESQLSVENSELESQPTAPSYGEMDHGLLIEAIQGFPYIFDLGNKEYKNNKKKQLAWQQISEVVNCSGRTYTTTNKEGRRPSSQLSGESRPSSSSSVWSSYSQIRSPTEVVEDGETPGPSKRANTPTEAHKNITTEAPGRSKTPNTPAVGGTPLSAFGHDKKRKRAQDIVGEVGPIVGVANSIMERLSKKEQNVNSTFVAYVYEELHKMSEVDAKKKKTNIKNFI
ncbi:unnamed protein product [Psylliodes chrysocephalus]|uniref:MADF domain-containing protein n=1 Tax=Psylliodes chrysocephalus TaxID=3402493 RepID=A0A9P0DAJ3_9CUCU|nr:unnamed protein product [Psylliodes chrysocephala]